MKLISSEIEQQKNLDTHDWETKSNPLINSLQYYKCNNCNYIIYILEPRGSYQVSGSNKFKTYDKSDIKNCNELIIQSILT